MRGVAACRRGAVSSRASPAGPPCCVSRFRAHYRAVEGCVLACQGTAKGAPAPYLHGEVSCGLSRLLGIASVKETRGYYGHDRRYCGIGRERPAVSTYVLCRGKSQGSPTASIGTWLTMESPRWDECLSAPSTRSGPPSYRLTAIARLFQGDVALQETQGRLRVGGVDQRDVASMKP